MSTLGTYAVDAARLWRRAVAETRGQCFGAELVQRRRFVQGPLAQLWRSLGGTDDWSAAWQRQALALCHTGSRRVVVGLEEASSEARLPVDDTARATLRVLVDAHFFSWFLVPPSARVAAPELEGPERVIAHPAQLLGLEGLPSKAPAAPPGPPWRVPRPSIDGRVRPDRVTLEGTLEGTPPDAGAVVPVAVRNMVPTGGNHLLPGWGSTAVVTQRLLCLDGLDAGPGGPVRVGAARHVTVGTSNLRREDLWRNATDGHAERPPLACPTEPTATPFRLLEPRGTGWEATSLTWRRF